MEKLRKNLRIKGYDYSQNGYYFVTICTDYRRQMFEPRISSKYTNVVSRPWRENKIITKNVVAGPWPAKFKENTEIVESKILNIEKKFSAEVDFYCIMPDHIHMIIIIKDCSCLPLGRSLPLASTRQGRATTNMVEAHRGQRARQGRATTTSLSWIVNAFKGWCTREFKNKIWQPNYYEHIIRSEKELEKIREYIENNPEKEILEFDEFYE